MSIRAGAILVVCVTVSACGGSRPDAAPSPGPGGGGPGASPDPARADAAQVTADAGAMQWPDAGPPDEPVAIADAGLPDIGIAECEAVFARVLACPGLSPEQKRSAADAHRQLRESADTASPERRAEMAAGCRELARSVEEALLDRGC